MTIRTPHLRRLAAALVTSAAIAGPAAAQCVDYDPPPPPGTWGCCGAVFIADGVAHTTNQFRWVDGTWFAGGTATIVNACNGVGGHSLWLNNINVDIDARDFYGGPGGPGVKRVTFWYEDFGGNVNLGVNGDLAFVQDNFHNIPAARFAGVGAMLTHSAVWTGSSWRGSVTIEAIPGGCIDRVTIGGQELCIDDVCGEDECGNPCPADFDGSGTVDIGDVLQLLSKWGPCPGCPEDLDGDGVVSFSDIVIVLSNWS